MSEKKLTPCQQEEIAQVCAKYGRDSKELVNILYQIQRRFGYLPERVQRAVAEELKISFYEVSDTVSSHSMFVEFPLGKCVASVCMGRGCAMRGSGEILKAFEEELGIEVGEMTEDGMFSLDTFSCVGACGQAPVVIFDQKLVTHVDVNKVRQLISDYRSRN